MFDPNDLKGLNDLCGLSNLSELSDTVTGTGAASASPPTGFSDIDDEKTIPQAAFDDTELAMASDDDVILVDEEERAMLVMFGVLDAP